MALPGKRADMIVHTDDPFNAESPRAALAAEPLTALDTFYVRNHGPIPHAGRPDRWVVRVHGLVATPLELTLARLRERFTEHRLVATLQCAGNRRAGLQAVRAIPGEAPWGPGATGTAEWVGARLTDLLDAVGPVSTATHVELLGADVSAQFSPPTPFGASIPLHKARGPEVLVAWAMNGRPLPPAHGAPVRAVVPGYIGARSVKWLTDIVLADHPSDNPFQAEAYRLLAPDRPPEAARTEGIALGAVAVNCDFLTPDDGARLAAGPRATFEGYAFAGDDRHVIRVDVSTDAGSTWQQASLLDGASPWAWRRWRIELALAPGEHEIVARAWDSAAATQPSHPAQLWNPKGYVNNSWARLRVAVG
jgi:sulfite oxidase